MAHDGNLDIRETAPDEWRVACDTMRAALLTGPVSDDDWVKAMPGWQDHLSFTAWDGQACVGHAGAFRFRTVVPGGARLATAGVTRIGVLPTATRRGVLSRMMRELLLAARAEGMALASLRASEAVIYRRFGFGIAADSASARIDTKRARPIAAAAPGSMRVLRRDQILDVVPPIYERVADRPGVISRQTSMWKRYLDDALEGDKAGFVVVHTDTDGTDDGFAHYTVAWHEESFSAPYGVGEVHDVWGASPGVELALWEHVLSIDLLRRVDVDERPLDDPLRLAVADPRAYETKDRFDEQWLRLLDVEASLVARSYRPGQPVSIAVHDPVFADNCATFEVSAAGVRRLGSSGTGVADGGAAQVTADLTVSIDAISSAYMGAVSWAELAAVGRVTGDAASIARADDLFACRPLAWCGSFF